MSLNVGYMTFKAFEIRDRFIPINQISGFALDDGDNMTKANDNKSRS